MRGVRRLIKRAAQTLSTLSGHAFGRNVIKLQPREFVWSNVRTAAPTKTLARAQTRKKQTVLITWRAPTKNEQLSDLCASGALSRLGNGRFDSNSFGPQGLKCIWNLHLSSTRAKKSLARQKFDFKTQIKINKQNDENIFPAWYFFAVKTWNAVAKS